ncbi:MAG: hypothetical protein WHS64_06925 [Fervidobacterium sp.]|uniref:Uncharacterized protein n=1 Tax=Fervidobacterium gondwanense DSM 13020 TaxID=1121883 RepID=A0A1M7T5E8_FERGO|nr:hypothetical protein [Fervidobacterium gondwanense]UXF00711.1 hypothetical protein IB67_03850 [Fervidobacterium riparium]SHN65959.1 hypothetical protein SAMN02745226_01567 [Fervidobacterium gondwanense DSM 13020]
MSIMSDPKEFSGERKYLKLVLSEYSYKPGPIMEEKIILKIKRRKVRSLIYRYGIAILIIISILFAGFEYIKPGSYTNSFTLMFHKAAETFKLFTENDNPSVIPASEDASLEHSNVENEENDVFKIIRYTAIASDGGW